MKKFFHFLLIAALALAPLPSLAQGMNPVNTLAGAVETQGMLPTLSSCGSGPTITPGSTNYMFEVTTGTGTACTVTLAGTHAKAPICMLVLENGVLAAFSYVVSITTGVVTIVVTQTSAASKFVGSCVWTSGGR